MPTVVGAMTRGAAFNYVVELNALGASAPTPVTLGTDRLALTAYTSTYLVAAESGTTDDIDGISGFNENQFIMLRADTGDTLTLKDENAGAASTSDRIRLPNGTDVSFTDDEVVLLWHDDTLDRWILIAGPGAAVALAAHVAAADPHAGYVLESLIDADGDLIVGSAADTVVRLAKGAADGYKLETRTGTPDLAWTKDYVPLLFIIDGGGATITTGVKGDIYLLENLTVEGWTLLADQSGSIVLDIWHDTYANYPPTVADTITASDKPTISTATKGQDLAPTGWTTSLAAGSSLRINVDSITTCQRVSLTLHCYRR